MCTIRSTSTHTHTLSLSHTHTHLASLTPAMRSLRRRSRSGEPFRALNGRFDRFENGMNLSVRGCVLCVCVLIAWMQYSPLRVVGVHVVGGRLCVRTHTRTSIYTRWYMHACMRATYAYVYIHKYIHVYTIWDHAKQACTYIHTVYFWSIFGLVLVTHILSTCHTHTLYLRGISRLVLVAAGRHYNFNFVAVDCVIVSICMYVCMYVCVCMYDDHFSLWFNRKYKTHFAS
jgi:hypothetical protein